MRLSFVTVDMERKLEDSSPPTWGFTGDQEAPNEYGGAYRMMIGAYEGMNEATWAYDYIKSIEVRQICNDANDIMYLNKVYNEKPSMRGFDIKRSIASGFVEVEVTVHFIDSLNMEPVVLTTRYTSHKEDGAPPAEWNP